MISQGAARHIESPKAARRRSNSLASSPGNVDSDIRNLPDNVIITQEILRNNVCRICATYYESGPWLLPLYLSDEGTKPLAKVFNAFLPIKLLQSDGLPEHACRSCVDKLHAWRAVWDTCAEVQKLLNSHVELLGGAHQFTRTDKSFTETVESVLSAYLVNSSMELVCHKCHVKTSSEEFSRHLSDKHGDVTMNAVDAFVRDNVTFEETLDSESDESDVDCASVGSAEASKVRLACPLCETEFFSHSRLYQHLAEHDVDIDEPCCGVTRTETELIVHLRTEHTVRSRCKSCNYVAAGPIDLNEHIAGCVKESTSHALENISSMKFETNQKRIPAVCPECNRTFSNKYNMLNHMKSHQESSTKFDCECGKSYSTRGNLAAHRRIVHARELRHACSECGKGFPSRAARDVHSRSHSGARPFSCSICSRSFRAKNSLDKHAETHRPRRYECELCGRRFRRKSHLRYHAGTHRLRRS